MVSASSFDSKGSGATSDGGTTSGEGRGGQFSVEADYLRSIIRPLCESMSVGRQVSGHPERLTQHLDNTGSEKFAEAAEHFISTWGYGMGRLVKDADLIVDKLQEAIDNYTSADEQAAQSMRGEAAAGGGGQGPVTSWVQDNVIEPIGLDDLPTAKDAWKSVFG